MSNFIAIALLPPGETRQPPPAHPVAKRNAPLFSFTIHWHEISKYPDIGLASDKTMAASTSCIPSLLNYSAFVQVVWPTTLSDLR